MAKYEMLEPTVDILKITAASYTLEDGSTFSVPVPTGADYVVSQTKAVISASQLAAEYIPAPLSA